MLHDTLKAAACFSMGMSIKTGLPETHIDSFTPAYISLLSDDEQLLFIGFGIVARN